MKHNYFGRVRNEPLILSQMINAGITLIVLGIFMDDYVLWQATGTTMAAIAGLGYMYLAWQNIKKMEG